MDRERHNNLNQKQKYNISKVLAKQKTKLEDARLI